MVIPADDAVLRATRLLAERGVAPFELEGISRGRHPDLESGEPRDEWTVRFVPSDPRDRRFDPGLVLVAVDAETGEARLLPAP